MIERKIGLVPIPTKTDDIVRLADGSEVKIPDNHTLICYILTQISKRRGVRRDPTWYFYEEINQRDRSWDGVLKFRRNGRGKDENKSPKPYQMVKF